MRIYKITTEHRRWGLSWKSYKVAAPTYDEAIRKVKKEFENNERLQEVELLAVADM